MDVVHRLDDPPGAAISNERWHEVFVLAEQRLGPHDWTVDRYSIADIHLFRLYWRFVIMLDIAPGVYPNLSRHFDRMMARPAVQHVLAAEAAVGYNMSLGFPGGENR